MVNDFNQSTFNFIQEPIQHVKHHPCNSLYTTEQKRTKLYSSRLNMSGHMQETYNNLCTACCHGSNTDGFTGLVYL